jgi:preprotein translocase subunit SecF
VSIAATLALVLLYVAFRFDIGFAPGAILALFHDVSLTVGIFVLAQLEFNLPMIGALLTIVGYSLNDTIVIYDRIRENRDRYRRKDLADLINVSINETLTRTVATSVTTILAITMLMFIGGPVIRNFAFAMFLGIIFGTYSTVFVASPMILVMEDVKPHLSKLIVTAGTDEPDPVDDPPEGESDEPLTEAEKRRRARAAADAGSTTTL